MDQSGYLPEGAYDLRIIDWSSDVCSSDLRTSSRIIGVTGSVGKTGTKEALVHALDRYAPYAVHRSVKSYNNHVGVPLSLARVPRESRFGIFEMGMNHSGELSALTRLVRPDRKSVV